MRASLEYVQRSIEKVKSEGGEILYGGEKLDGAQFPGGCYMKPCLATARPISKSSKEMPLAYLTTAISMKRWRFTTA